MTTTDTDAPERIAIDPDYVPDHSQHFGTLVKYIRADLAKPRVKPLVWKKGDGESWVVGEYTIIDCGYRATPSTRYIFFIRGEWYARATLEAAKAAVNAHRAAYVLAQLEGET